MISSILNRHTEKIVIDRLEVDNDLITDPELIRSHTAKYFQTCVGAPSTDGTILDTWTADYRPLDTINDSIYDDLMVPPSFTEWFDFISKAPANKAPGPSQLSYDIMKHLGPIALDIFHQLTCACFNLNCIPIGWKRAAIYPIPKPTAWQLKLNNTRPITLLESPRKILVKILNARLSKILSAHTILQPCQFAGLPGGSTMSPITVIKHMIDDARLNNKEIWIYLQDLSKCYDRVDTRILRHAMTRLKIPIGFINLTLDLFNNRKNYVLTDVGKTKDYEVLVGIDQGEVISPLLWCIYYDPLLTRIQADRSLGYSISHTYSDDIHAPNNTTTDTTSIPALAYMDDTLWCTQNQGNLEKILSTTASFSSFTNIKLNDDKAKLLSSTAKLIRKGKRNPFGALPLKEIVFNLANGQTNKVALQPYNKSIRYLGAWISLKNNNNFIATQARNTMTRSANTMRHSKLTDLQLLYIHNKVLIPQLEYRTQVTVLSKDTCHSIVSPFLKLFKNKLNLARTAPRSILLNQWFYKYRDFYGVQLQSKLSNFLVALNNNTLLDDTIHVMLRQYQTFFGLACSPLLNWPYKDFSKSVSGYFLPALISLCSGNDFFYEVPSQHKHIITGGSDPLSALLSVQQLTKTRIFRVRYN